MLIEDEQSGAGQPGFKFGSTSHRLCDFEQVILPLSLCSLLPDTEVGLVTPSGTFQL